MEGKAKLRETRSAPGDWLEMLAEAAPDEWCAVARRVNLDPRGVMSCDPYLMARYFTADLHLGHRNIIDYSGRPFRDVEQMDEALVERWNMTVAPDDEVMVLGDFAMGRIDETLPVAGVLNGRKVLLAGNHDRCWHGHRKGAEAATDRYLAAGFDEIRQGTIDLSIGGVPVIACHFPYRGDSHDHDRHVAHRPVDAGAWLLHGHVHERWKVRERMINVGVDVWDFAPVAECTLAELITPPAPGVAPTT